jgi:hypothetical protein
MSTRHTNSQEQSPLFKLPPELRNRIYLYTTSQSEAKKPLSCKLSDEGNHFTHYYDPSYDYKGHHSLPIVSLNHISDVKPSNALLGTCQRIYQEAKGMFVASQRAFWRNQAFVCELHDGRPDDVSALQEVLTHLHPGQIDAMPKFIVAMTTGGCFDEFHFIEDDMETTDEEINDGYAPNCGFCCGGCSHHGGLSLAELTQRCEDLKHGFCHAVADNALDSPHDLKRRLARERTRIAVYEKLAKGHVKISARGRECSKKESHAILRWKEERPKYMMKLESEDLNMKCVFFDRYGPALLRSVRSLTPTNDEIPMIPCLVVRIGEWNGLADKGVRRRLFCGCEGVGHYFHWQRSHEPDLNNIIYNTLCTEASVHTHNNP